MWVVRDAGIEGSAEDDMRGGLEDAEGDTGEKVPGDIDMARGSAHGMSSVQNLLVARRSEPDQDPGPHQKDWRVITSTYILPVCDQTLLSPGSSVDM